MNVDCTRRAWFEHHEVGGRADGNPSQIAPPNWSAGVVAHIRAASTSDTPARRTSIRNAPSIVSTLPARVPSSSSAVRSVTTIGWPPRRAREPTGSPDPAVPSVMAMMPSTPLARIATRISAGWT